MFRSRSILVVVAACLLLAPAFVAPLAPRSAGPESDRGALRGTATTAPVEMEAEAAPAFRPVGAALSLLAALAVALAPVAEAQAAKMGGKMGGTAPSKEKSKPAPSQSTTINRTTVVNKTVVVQQPAPVVAPAPMVAAPVVAGPSVGDMIVGTVVGNAISNAISGPRGPSGSDQMLANQQRQDERQMDRQAAELDLLRKEVQDMKIAQAAKN